MLTLVYLVTTFLHGTFFRVPVQLVGRFTLLLHTGVCSVMCVHIFLYMHAHGVPPARICIYVYIPLFCAAL